MLLFPTDMASIKLLHPFFPASGPHNPAFPVLTCCILVQHPLKSAFPWPGPSPPRCNFACWGRVWPRVHLLAEDGSIAGKGTVCPVWEYTLWLKINLPEAALVAKAAYRHLYPWQILLCLCWADRVHVNLQGTRLPLPIQRGCLFSSRKAIFYQSVAKKHQKLDSQAHFSWTRAEITAWLVTWSPFLRPTQIFSIGSPAGLWSTCGWYLYASDQQGVRLGGGTPLRPWRIMLRPALTGKDNQRELFGAAAAMCFLVLCLGFFFIYLSLNLPKKTEIIHSFSNFPKAIFSQV